MFKKNYLKNMKLDLTVLVLVLIFPVTSFTQNNFEAVIGKVDSEPITTYDLSQKIKLMLNTMGLSDTIENRDSIRERAVELIIEEKVKLIETKKENIEIDDKEVDAFISEIFGFPSDEKKQFINFLNNQDIDYDILFEQIKTELLWKRLVSRKFGGLISPNPEMVSKILNEYQKKLGLSEYNFSEIVIYKNNYEIEETMSSIKNVENLIKLGTSFESVASEFSQSPSSVNSGNLGWIIESQIENEILRSLQKMSSGEVSEIIDSKDSLRIIKLLNHKKIGEKNDKEYSILNISSSDNKTEMLKIKDEIESCNDNFSNYTSNDNIKIDRIENVLLQDLSPEIKKVLENVKIGQKTRIVEQNQRKMFFIICNVKGGEISNITKQQVEQKLFQEKLGIMSRTHLNKLKKQSNIILSIN